jgi:hypothetical protein
MRAPLKNAREVYGLLRSCDYVELLIKRTTSNPHKLTDRKKSSASMVWYRSLPSPTIGSCPMYLSKVPDVFSQQMGLCFSVVHAWTGQRGRWKWADYNNKEKVAHSP